MGKGYTGSGDDGEDDDEFNDGDFDEDDVDDDFDEDAYAHVTEASLAVRLLLVVIFVFGFFLATLVLGLFNKLDTRVDNIEEYMRTQQTVIIEMKN